MQRSIGLGGLKTSKLHALKNVSGVLKPVGYPFYEAHPAFVCFSLLSSFCRMADVTRQKQALCLLHDWLSLHAMVDTVP